MTLNRIFANGMVFAERKSIRIFGTGKGKVSVDFLNYHKEMISESDGKWIVEFPAQQAGGPYEIAISLDGKEQILSDVYIGKVILLHGQSNLQFQLHESNYPVEKYESFEKLRLFSMDRIEKGAPWESSDGWILCDRQTAGKWSAIGYHVGMRVAKETGCAVGLIACFQGASVIQSWLPKGSLEEMNIFFEKEAMHRDHFYPMFIQFNLEGALYQHMVLPLTPYAISDVIWYQGESNTSTAEGKVYDRMLKRLIEQRRCDFMDPDLRFIVVQLADNIECAGKGWSSVQDAQWRIGQSMKNVRTVICRDICEKDDIHPPSKEELSKRISDILIHNG